ncbi:MAG TPA: S-layer homology domain-containing protein [Thermoanaerobaculia bacterium]|nr:S-layer homology domain-containing protein [Thermoanaerobaculia bacterium]
MNASRRWHSVPAVAATVFLLGAAAGRAEGSKIPTFAATTQAPTAYGLGDYTVTTISATSFTADNTNYFTTLCCLSRGFNNGDGEFYSNVDVPAGAVIDYIGLESYSTCAGVAGVELWEVTHGFTSGIATFSSTSHGYATDYNASPIGYLNVQNNGKALVAQVELSSACANYPAFTWVEIWWRRTVSTAPGSPTFNDVPANDPAFQFIEALAASGVTGGCGGGNYCPDNPVTRRQMAVFLAKALGLHWPH